VLAGVVLLAGLGLAGLLVALNPSPPEHRAAGLKADEPLGAGGGRASGSRGWLGAGVLLGLLVAGTFGVWLVVRQRRRAVSAPPGPPAEGAPAKPAAASPSVSVPCPGCGKVLRAKAALAGKKAKCPHCGVAVLIPAAGGEPPSAPAPAPARKGYPFGAWALLGLLGSIPLVLLALYLGWRLGPSGARNLLPSEGKKPSFIGVTLGSEPVEGVEESGFSYQEYDQDQPFRWTDGKGRLVIPLDKTAPPQALVMHLRIYRLPDVRSARLQVVANDQELFGGDVPVGRWDRTFDLSGINLGEQLVLELRSDTFAPLGIAVKSAKGGGKEVSDDPRALGVLVMGIKLLGRTGTGTGVSVFTKGMTAWPDRPHNLYCAALTPDGKTLVTGSWDGTVTVWDAAAGRARTSFSIRAGPQAIAVSPDGTSFATASGRVVRVWDAETGQPRADLRGHAGEVTALAYSPDGKTLASAAGNRFQAGELKLWDPATGTEQVRVEPFKLRLWAVAYAPDGRRVAVAGGDGTASVVDTGTGQVVASFSHPTWAHGVAFSPDGNRLAVSYGDDGRVPIYDLGTGKEWSSLQAPQGSYVGRPEFSGDGSHLVTPGVDGTAVVWDVSRPQAPAATLLLTGHDGPVRFALFVPDGQTIVTGQDGTVGVWNLDRLPAVPDNPAAAPPNTR
jgi:hypothetical protein